MIHRSQIPIYQFMTTVPALRSAVPRQGKRTPSLRTYAYYPSNIEQHKATSLYTIT
ncbi:unnamed protein product [Laminaria digitata]